MSRFKNLKASCLMLLLSVAGPISADGISDVYVIGDSLSDQGNLFVATETLVGTGIPDAAHYFSGRFSDQGNYVDELAAKLGLDEPGPSILGGHNFAYGGSRTDYNRVELDASKPFPVNFLGQGGIFAEDAYPWTLQGQVQSFRDFNIFDPNGLYIVFSGSNDLGDLTAVMAFILPGQNQFADAFINNVVSGIDAAIEKFVDAGARDIIVPNLPNLGLVPSVVAVGPGFAGLATQLVERYNAALEEKLAGWENRVNIIRFDTFSFFTEITQNPAEFGFDNVTDACYSGFVTPPAPGEAVTVCANPDKYMFWDKEHPTYALHTVLADAILFAAAVDILSELELSVAALDAKIRIKYALAAKLKVVSKLLTDDNALNDRAAPFILRAFVNSVKAQAGKKLAADDAASLIERAERISELLVAR